jgi:hypothetical protein
MAKTKKTRKSKSAKAKLETLKKIDGQDANAPLPTIKETSPGGLIKSINALFNFDGCVYKTHSEEEYRTSLAGLNTYAIQQECQRCGLLPNDNKNIMLERLMKKFRQVNSSILGPQRQPIKLNVSKLAKEIMAEGANRPY